MDEPDRKSGPGAHDGNSQVPHQDVLFTPNLPVTRLNRTLQSPLSQHVNTCVLDGQVNSLVAR